MAKLIFIIHLFLLIVVQIRGINGKRRTGFHERCKLENLQLQDDFQLEQLSGLWYEVARTPVRGSRVHLQSPVSEWTVSTSASFTLRYTGRSREGECLEQPISLQGTYTSGQLLHVQAPSGSDAVSFLNGDIRVVYVDSDIAVMFVCFALESEGHCQPATRLVWIMSRRPSLSLSQRSAIYNIIQRRLCVRRTYLRFSHKERACLPLYEIIETSPPNQGSAPESASQVRCEVQNCSMECPQGYLADSRGCDTCQCDPARCAVPMCSEFCPHGYKHNQYGCMTCECEEESATPEAMPQAAAIIMPQLVERKAKACVPNLTPLTTLDLTKMAGTWYILALAADKAHLDSAKVHMAITSDSTIKTYYTGSKDGNCLPVSSGNLIPSQAGSAVLGFDYGGIKQGTTTVLYVDEDYEYVILHQCMFEQSTEDSTTCQNPSVDLMGRQPHLPHDVKTRLVQAVGPLCIAVADLAFFENKDDCPIDIDDEHTDGEKKCRIAEIETAVNIDWNKMQGRWYSVAKLKSRDIDQSGQYRFTMSHDGHVNVAYRGSRGGLCKETTRTSLLPHTLDPGNVEIRFGTTRARGKFTYADHQMALYYECDKEAEDGACLEGGAFVEILHRDRQPPDDVIEQLKEHLEKLCISTSDMAVIDHSLLCPLSEQCTVDNIPTQEGFDIYRFFGDWETLASLRETSGWDSNTINIIPEGHTSSKMVITSTGAINGTCRPTSFSFLASLTRNNPADLKVFYGRTLARFKVVYTDYNYAVVYECPAVTADGYCVSGHEVVQVWGRRGRSLEGITLENKRQLLASVCKYEEEFAITKESVVCPIVKPLSECRLRGLPLHPAFKIDKFEGIWYGVASSRMTSQPEMVRMDVEKLSEGKIQIITKTASGNTCLPAKVSIYFQSSKNPAEFYGHVGRKIGLLRVAYTSYNEALIYTCPLEKGKVTCDPTNIEILILSREKSIKKSLWKFLQRVVGALCWNPRHLTHNTHRANCDDPVPTSPTTCRINYMPVMQKFNLKMFTGTWYIVSHLSGTMDSVVIEIQTLPDERTTVRSYGTVNGECQNPTKTYITQHQSEVEGEFEITFGHVRGRLLVSFTDYQHAVIYECLHEDGDSHCIMGQDNVYILSRDMQMSDQIQSELQNIVINLCVNPSLLTPVSHDVDCRNIPLPSCQAYEIPVQSRFEIHKFVGRWYSVARMKGTPSWQSGVVEFVLLKNGSIAAYHSTSRHGKCIPPIKTIFNPVPGESNAIWVTPSKVLNKVVYTDYETALVYICNHVTPDGACEQGQMEVDVLSRKAKSRTHDMMGIIAAVAPSICLTRKHFERTFHEVDCEVQPEPEECIVTQVPAQQGLDPNLLLGEWFSYARVKETISIESARYLITREDPTSLKLYYTGSRNGKCLFTGSANVAMTSPLSGRFKLTFDGDQGDLWVLYADEQHVVLYECYSTKPDGTCPLEDAYIEILSRHQQIPNHVIHRLHHVIKSVCFHISDFVLTTHEVECSLKLHREICTFDDIIEQQDFDIRSIVGRWHTAARLLRKNSPQLSATTNILLYRNRQQLDILWSGKLNGDCIEQVQGHVRVLGKDSLVRSMYGNHTSITKIIYADDDFLVTYDCALDDPSVSHIEMCPRDLEEVEIYTRGRDINLATWNFLDDIIRRKTCVDINRLERIAIHKDECQPPDTQSKMCRVQDIETEGNFHPSQAEGVWFQLARTDLPHVTWDSGMTSIVADDSSLSITYRGKVKSGSAQCMAVYEMKVLEHDAKPGHFHYQHPSRGEGILKVLHADERYMVIYHCMAGGLTPSGLCRTHFESVDVYSKRRYVNSDTEQRLRDVITGKLCMSIQNIIMTNHSNDCYISAYANPHKDKECRVSYYTPQDDVDLERFSGVWYEIERTRYTRSNTWESGVGIFRFRSPDTLLFSYVGSRDGMCLGPFEGYARPSRSGGHGDMYMWIGHEQSHDNPWSPKIHYKVIYTDYQSAIIYSCFDVKDDGRCRPHGEQVDILSRSRDMDAATRGRLYNIIIERLCVNIYDFVEPALQADCEHILGVTEEPSLPTPMYEVTCTPMECAIFCPYGFAQDVNGCNICECQVSQLSGSGEVDGSGEMTPSASLSSGQSDQFIPPIYTQQFGSGSGEDNINDLCPPVLCGLDCPGGFERDHNGCHTCRCKSDTHSTVHVVDIDVICSPVACELECDNDFQKDSAGCDICACAVSEMSSISKENILNNKRFIYQ